MNKPNYAKNIQYLMDKVGIKSVNELANKVGISQPTLFRWMLGDAYEPKYSKIAPLAEYFGVAVGDLFNKDLSAQPTIVDETLNSVRKFEDEFEKTKSLFAEALMIDRISRKMTQQQAADKLGFGQQSWSKWEAGINYPRKEKIRKIVNLFGSNSMTAKFFYKHETNEPVITNHEDMWVFKSIKKSDFDDLDVVQKAIVEKTLKALIDMLAVQKFL